MRGRPKQKYSRGLICKVRLNNDEMRLLNDLAAYFEVSKSEVLRMSLRHFCVKEKMR